MDGGTYLFLRETDHTFQEICNELVLNFEQEEMQHLGMCLKVVQSMWNGGKTMCVPDPFE